MSFLNPFGTVFKKTYSVVRELYFRDSKKDYTLYINIYIRNVFSFNNIPIDINEESFIQLFTISHSRFEVS